ncbi:Fic/DOC family protein [Candidatus Methanoplasma termitum]|uniref:Fic/DOC family protein n=1 Tax=Candidatus Methanoplasma termitum TaxID=1577791 RepID=A0A0A7LI40_9ARCH|nr:Fic family protein [Candidatus Methanoplasma termitum]AIZ57161.1 Fic/DOC family protein [Candidatus Methanoplasma termitum]
MRRYDYSFIRNLKISAGIVSLTNKIESSKIQEKQRKKVNSDIFVALESIARVQSVKGSNAIEGIVTTDRRMEEIVNKNSAPLNHNEMEIAGYRDVLDLIHREYRTLELNEELILGMHKIMSSYTPRGGGMYKEQDNIIISTDENGARSVRFVPVTSKETPKAMEQLILAYMEAKDDAGIDPLILIPCFILDFLCIHPFSDGNGRISRLMTLLLMYKNDIDVGKYVSFEAQINESKNRYYEALKRSSEEWHSDKNDYVPFIENFIFTLFSCYKELDRRFDVVGDKRVNKGNRVEAAVLNSMAPISKAEISELLPDISITTIEAKLSELQKQGKIKKIGDKKSAKYMKK